MLRSGSRAALALVTGAMLLVVACGSDDNTSSSTAAGSTTAGGTGTTTAGGTGTTTAGTATTAAGPGSAVTTAVGGSTATTTAAAAGTAGCPAIDSSIDAVNGKGAGAFESNLTCADAKPLAAAGDPIVIGMENPEGDPNGSFPEFSLAAQAAADYINKELGGLGADIQNGKPGRPVKLIVCKTAISPDDSQRCANELLAQKPVMALSTVNFFGNNIPIFTAGKVPVLVIAPITVADYTSPGTYAIAGGGGCVGSFTGMGYFVTHNLKAKRVGIPWSDTPPGVVCYYDLEAKPLDVLNGKVKGTSKEAGSMPDLTYMGVPIKPATPDVTPFVTQILGFKPDAMMYSGSGADCWNLVSGLGRAGWTPDQIPLVLGGACIDFDAMKAAGDLAKGVYFIGSGGTIFNDPTTISDPFGKFEAEYYVKKTKQYGLAADQVSKGFAENGFAAMLELWELSSQLQIAGSEISSTNLADAFKNTDGQHSFGSTPLSCAKALSPYTAVCNTDVTVSQWDGKALKTLVPKLSGFDLVAGTPIKTGP